MASPLTTRPRTLVAPAHAQRIDAPRGSIAYWEPRSQLYATQARGHMTHEMAQLIIARAEPLYRPGAHVVGFHDWFAMNNYDSSCRVELTAWVLRHRAETTLHIGVSSRLVAMGVAVANLALGSLIHVHTEPSSFQAAFAAALRAAP